MLFTLGILLAAAAPNFATAGAEFDALLAQKVDHFAQAHQRAQKTVRRFDAELDEAVAAGESGFLLRSGTYLQLQALREIETADLETIGTALTAASPEESAKAARFLQTKLAALPSRTAAAALAGDLNAHFGDILTPLNNDEVVPETRELPSLNLQLMPGLLDLEIAQITSRLVYARQAAAAKIRPGVGPEGNLTGSTFPANTWALTFDDGPSSRYTKQVVDALTAHGKKASFFWLAENVSRNHSVIAYAQKAGMSLNDHSFTHANLSKASPAALQHEIVESAALEAKAYGERPEFFRLPYGAGVHVTAVRELIAEQNMVHVFWNVDSLDWQDKDPNVILARVKKEMKLEKRGIILFHDIHPQSLAAAKLLLDYADTRPELRWVTIPQIRDELNGKP
jgi:peptidoglycan/xylan/chitin deacetylase (PgdA/CDA1 family)